MSDTFVDTPLGGWPGRGSTTLVLGAGVSRSRGVPLWGELVDRLWKETVAARIDPLPHPFEGQTRLELVHRWLSDHGGPREEVARDLEAWWARRKPPREVRFEADGVPPRADDVFRELIRRALYRDVSPRTTDDSLGAIARVVRREADRERGRRLLRVISFNADSLLEEEVNRDHAGVCPIAAANTPPMRYAALIPVYHVHGYLPSFHWPIKSPPVRTRSRHSKKAKGSEGFHEDGGLVFRDSEYWGSVASPLSFANRIVANALQDSRCIFIGLSMTDVNLWRWLSIRAGEIEELVRAQSERQWRSNWPGDESLWMRITHEQSHEGHLWIRAGEDPSADRISEFLARQRGVKTLKLPSWGPPFVDALDRLLPEGA